MIRVEGLRKRFGKVVALDGVDFTAQDACITGLLGPNGAGKSTCLRILYTVLRADAGSAWVDDISVGQSPTEARSAIGVLPHLAGLYPNLTARENIAYYGRLQGMRPAELGPRVDELAERLELKDILDRRAKGFSQGQRTKVALARAMVHKPKHLLLDEPTNGLDVMATRSLRELLKQLREDGHCIIFSSHIMAEVATLCDELVIISAGRVALRGTPQALAEQQGRDLEDVFVDAVSGVDNQ